MPFLLSPVIDTMIGLYEKPRSMERFNDYLKILTGNTKADLVVPIGNFNPMGKEHVLGKLMELKALNAEGLMNDVLSEINKHSENRSIPDLRVSLALSDDLKGAWTNRYTTDYDSKFKLNALVTRNFCTPLFWTSESYSAELIKKRTLEYCLRTLYWLNAPKPKTLEEHIRQEKFVAQKSFNNASLPQCDMEALDSFYRLNKNTERYDLIFNFLYGDNACKELAFPSYGIKDDDAGYKYAIIFRNKS